MSESQPQRRPWTQLLFAEPLGATGWQDVGLLLARVYAGVTMAGAGMDKIPVGSWFSDQVAGIGFPLPRFFAFAAAFSEFAGGWLLVLGLFSRPAAFFMAVTMGVASWTIHADVPFWSMHIARIFFWLYLCLTFTGAGRFSCDQLLRQGRLPGWVAAVPLLWLTGLGGYQELLVAPRQATTPSVSLDDVTVVSVAGTFNNWTLDATPMTRDDEGVWRATVAIDQSGPIEFKFAANNDWALNCGASPEAKSGFPLQAIGLPNFGSEPGNIKAYIPEDGIYEFTFRLEDMAYSLQTPQPPADAAPLATEAE